MSYLRIQQFVHQGSGRSCRYTARYQCHHVSDLESYCPRTTRHRLPGTVQNVSITTSTRITFTLHPLQQNTKDKSTTHTLQVPNVPALQVIYSRTCTASSFTHSAVLKNSLQNWHPRTPPAGVIIPCDRNSEQKKKVLVLVQSKHETTVNHALSHANDFHGQHNGKHLKVWKLAQPFKNKSQYDVQWSHNNPQNNGKPRKKTKTKTLPPYTTKNNNASLIEWPTCTLQLQNCLQITRVWYL